MQPGIQIQATWFLEKEAWLCLGIGSMVRYSGGVEGDKGRGMSVSRKEQTREVGSSGESGLARTEVGEGRARADLIELLRELGPDWDATREPLKGCQRMHDQPRLAEGEGFSSGIL
jgi:hypothetical protein